jgi:hypothetical protein
MLMPTSVISCSTGRRKPFVITRRACGLAICHWGRTSKGFSGGVTLTTGRFSGACTGTALCWWRPGRFEEAERVFDRMLWPNPFDNQGVRGLIGPFRKRLNWEDD